MESHGHDADSVTSTLIKLAEECDTMKSLDEFDGYARVQGVCGDVLDVWIKTRNGTIEDASCRVQGCIPSKACMVSAIRLVKGKKIREVEEFSAREILLHLDLPEEAEHCAVLAVDAPRAALKSLTKEV